MTWIDVQKNLAELHLHFDALSASNFVIILATVSYRMSCLVSDYGIVNKILKVDKNAQ